LFLKTQNFRLKNVQNWSRGRLWLGVDSSKKVSRKNGYEILFAKKQTKGILLAQNKLTD
jgi:hypothetical protein